MPGGYVPLWAIPIFYVAGVGLAVKRGAEKAFGKGSNNYQYAQKEKPSKLAALHGNLKSKIHSTIHPDKLKNALEKDPNNPQLHLDNGMDLMKQGRIDECIEEFKTVLKIDPFTYSAWGFLGYALIIEMNFVDGIQAFTNLINVQRNEQYTSTNLNNAHKFILTDFRKPTLCSVCHHLLLGLTKQGYQCSSCKKPFHVDCSKKVMYTCIPSSSSMQKKKFDSGHQLTSTVIFSLTWCKTCGKNVGNRHRPKLCTQCRNTFHPSCVNNTDFCLASPCEVSLPLSLSGRGTCYYQLQKYPEAIKDFTDAINLSAADPFSDTQVNNSCLATFFANRGLCHMVLKDYRAAISDFSTAIGLDLKDSAIFTARSTAFLLLGMTDEAEADRLLALEINPNEIVNIFPYELPRDLVYEVFSHLRVQDLKQAALTCKLWNELIYTKFLKSPYWHHTNPNIHHNNNNALIDFTDFMT